MTLLNGDKLYGYDRYKRGDNWQTDDRTEARIRRSDSREEWTGAIVHKDDWEARNAQDFVQGVPDDQSVPDPRPVPTPNFVGFFTTQTVGTSAAGSHTVTVESSARFLVGDSVGLYTQARDLFVVTVTDIPTASSLKVSPALPDTVPDGMAVLNYSASAPTDLG